MKNDHQPNDTLHLIRRIAFELVSEAIWYKNRCTWIEEYQVSKNSYVTQALNSNFYDGISGLLFFLSEFYRYYPDDLLLKCIRGSSEQLKYILKDEKLTCSFFTGSIGAGYSLLRASKTLEDDSLKIEALELINNAIKEDIRPQIDVIQGISGVVPCLLHIHKNYNLHGLDQKVIQLGTKLIQGTIIDQSLDNSMWNKEVNLCGFSHGASGVANALLDLYNLTSDQKFLNGSLLALNYENQFFSEAEQNWADLRSENILTYPSYWCHGAPGIGFTRLKTRSIPLFQSIQHQLEICIDTTIKASNVNNLESWNLCHGILGNSIFLYKAMPFIRKEEINKFIQNLFEIIIEENFYKNNPFQGDHLNKPITKSFMTGKSGIGYALMILSGYDIPSILDLSFDNST